MKMLLYTILLAAIMVNMAPEAKAFPMQNSSLKTSSTASPQLSYITSTTPPLLKTIMVDLKSSGPATTVINTLHTSKISSTALAFQTPSSTTPISSVTTPSVSQSVNSSSTVPTSTTPTYSSAAGRASNTSLFFIIVISVLIVISVFLIITVNAVVRRKRRKRSKNFEIHKLPELIEYAGYDDECQLALGQTQSGIVSWRPDYDKYSFPTRLGISNPRALTALTKRTKSLPNVPGASVQVHVPRIQAKEVITVDGGALETENATLQIGPGCLTKDTQITMIMDNHHFAFKSLIDLGILSVYPRVIEFLPDGLKFESPAQLTIHLDVVVPSGLELFALHGAYSRESERIMWEVFNGDIQVNVKGRYVTMKINGFCFYTYIMSTRGRLPRILSHLNNSFYCDAVALYRRLPASPFIEVAIVLVSQFVEQNEQLAMMVNKNRYREGATGARELVKTGRFLEVCLEFPGMDAENSHIFKPDACRLDTVGMVINDLQKITQGFPTGGQVVIREIHRNSKRHLWTLDICEETSAQSDSDSDDPADIELSREEIKRLSRLITVDWDSLAGHLDIPYDVREEMKFNMNEYPNCRSKAEKILSKINKRNSLSRKLLIKCLTMLNRHDLLEVLEEVNPGESCQESDDNQNNDNAFRMQNCSLKTSSTASPQLSYITSTTPALLKTIMVDLKSSGPDVEGKVVLPDNTPLSSREMCRLSREILDWGSLAALMEIDETERRNILISLAHYPDVKSKAEKTLSIFNKSTKFCRQKLAEYFKEIGQLNLVDIVKTGEYRSLEMVEL